MSDQDAFERIPATNDRARHLLRCGDGVASQQHAPRHEGRGGPCHG